MNFLKRIFKKKTNFEKAVDSVQKLNIEELKTFREVVNEKLDRLSAEIIYEKIKPNNMAKIEIGHALDLMEKIEKRDQKCEYIICRTMGGEDQTNYYDLKLEKITDQDNLKLLLSEKGLCEKEMDKLANKVFVEQEVNKLNYE